MLSSFLKIYNWLIAIIDSAATEAIEAPYDLNFGINIKFKHRFTTAPRIIVKLYMFCFFGRNEI